MTGGRALLLTVYLAGPHMQAQFLNSKLKHKRHPIHSVLLFPTQVNISDAGITGSSNLPEESQKIGDDLSAVVRTYLTAHSALVLPLPDAPRSDAERYQLAEMQKRYDVAEPQILKHPKDVSKGRFTLSDSVAAYIPAASVDALIFIRGKGVVTSRTEKALGRVPGPWMWASKDQYFDGRITFVDAHSGEVMLLLAFTTYGHGWKQTAEELMPRIKDAALKMPVPIHEILGTK
jgi:hypothetical protein